MQGGLSLIRHDKLRAKKTPESRHIFVWGKIAAKRLNWPQKEPVSSSVPRLCLATFRPLGGGDTLASGAWRGHFPASTILIFFLRHFILSRQLQHYVLSLFSIAQETNAFYYLCFQKSFPSPGKCMLTILLIYPYSASLTRQTPSTTSASKKSFPSPGKSTVKIRIIRWENSSVQEGQKTERGY